MENPAFDSQTKETLTSKRERLGHPPPMGRWGFIGVEDATWLCPIRADSVMAISKVIGTIMTQLRIGIRVGPKGFRNVPSGCDVRNLTMAFDEGRDPVDLI